MAVTSPGSAEFREPDYPRPEGKPDSFGLRDLWEQGSLMLSLFGLLAYLSGRLLTDGFYSQLGTTPEAAGIGYSTILEPAAIAVGLLGAVWVVMAMLISAFALSSKAISILSYVIMAVLVIASSGADLLATAFSAVELTDAAGFLVLLAGSLPPLGAVAGKIFSYRSGVKRGINIILALTFIGTILFLFHRIGVEEGRLAAAGKTVKLEFIGFQIPSISASEVRVRPIVPSKAFARLDAPRCWLEIGSGSSSVLLYESGTKVTLTVPADQIVMMSESQSCPIS